MDEAVKQNGYASEKVATGPKFVSEKWEEVFFGPVGLGRIGGEGVALTTLMAIPELLLASAQTKEDRIQDGNFQAFPAQMI